ncbi:MAG: N-acetylglucosamine-6-phosphate deacetylase, partial [Pyrinomonadaceae bacterium]
FVNSAQCGALRTAYFKVFDNPAQLNALAMVKHESVTHLITLAPEIEGGIELVGELRRRGFVVSIGHTRAEVETLDAAFAAGARHMTHFFNAMTPLHHRRPGPVGWGLMRDAVTCDIIADGVHADPLMLALALRCKTAERLVLISDAVAPAGLGDGEFQMWGETITVTDRRTSNERGSIAGSVISLRDAVRMMLGLGVPEHEVAQMASLNPARLLGIDDRCGSIEEGKRADLAALDDEGTVRLTLVGGRIAFDAR